MFGKGKVEAPVPLGPYASDRILRSALPRNPTQAKKYLKLAGMPKGFSFTAITSMISPTPPAPRKRSPSRQSELAKVGHQDEHPEPGLQRLHSEDRLKGKFQVAFAENGADPRPLRHARAATSVLARTWQFPPGTAPVR